MGPATDQIARDLDRSREELRANLQELEHRARSATDWRRQFRRHPAVMLGAAMAGGMLLAAWMRGRDR